MNIQLSFLDDEERDPGHDGFFWSIFVTSKLSGELPGWARINPTSYLQIKEGVPKNVTLESLVFTKKVYTYSEPKNLIYELFAPDTMEWYLQLSPPPIIEVDKNLFFIGLAGKGSIDNISALVQAAVDGVRKVETSGAIKAN